MLGVIFLAAFVNIIVAEVTYFNNDGFINLRKTLPPTVIRLHLRPSEENEVSLEDHDNKELSGNPEEKEETSKNPGDIEKQEFKDNKTKEENQLSKVNSTNEDGLDKSESQEKQTNVEAQEKSVGKQKTEEGQEILGSIEKQKNEEVPETDASKEQLKKKRKNRGYKQTGNNYYIEKSNYAQESVGLIWPLGIVPYFVDNNSYDELLARRIRESMDMIESASCVRFKPVLKKPNGKYSWLHFTNPNNVRTCSHATSSISRNDTEEETEIPVVIGLDCLKRRDVLHAVLHAIGLKDEVTHPQRDLYVRVIWENIHPEYRDLFLKDNQEHDTQILVEYDPTSIMHFHDRAFSRNGQATIAPMMPGLRINPSETLSHLDKLKLRLIFSHECNRRKVDDLMDTCKMALHGHVPKKLAALEYHGIDHKDNQDDHDDGGLESGDNIKQKPEHDEIDDGVISKEKGDNDKSTNNSKENSDNKKSGDNRKEKSENDKTVGNSNEKSEIDKFAGSSKENSANVKSRGNKKEKRGTEEKLQLSNEDSDPKYSEPKDE